MGWTGIQHDSGRKLKADEIRRYIEGKQTDSNGVVREWKFTTIKSNVAYGYYSTDGKPEFILVVLIKNGKDELTYKEMTEMEGPSEHRWVPKKLLSLVPCPIGLAYASEWRKKATDWYNKNSKKVSMYHQLEVGHIVEYDCDMNASHGNIFTITIQNLSRAGRKQFLGKSSVDGKLYKIVPNKVRFILAMTPKAKAS
jgi:hypothetical protein